MKNIVVYLTLILSCSLAMGSSDSIVLNQIDGLIKNTPPSDFSNIHFESNFYPETLDMGSAEEPRDHFARYSDVCGEFTKLHQAKGYVTRLVKKINHNEIDLKTPISTASDVKIHEYQSLYSDGLLVEPEAKDLILVISKELLKYHEKITAIEQWEKKLSNVQFTTNQYARYRKGMVFHDAGFPFPESPCFVSAVGYGDSKGGLHYTEFDVTLDAWLYSFWYRRLSEGSFEVSYNIISSIVTMLSR